MKEIKQRVIQRRMSNIYKEDFVDTGEVIQMELNLDKLHKYHKEDK